jgi:prepilin-type N-terminal cleavage/methylation domain-containing protein
MLRVNNGRTQRGDTLIEVLFAMTVFSLIVVTALSLMGQGVAAAQRSLEITTVRQQIDGQAEALRFMHEAYVAGYQTGQTFNLTDGISTPAEEYYKIIQFTTGKRTQASKFAGTATCAIPSSTATDFIINPVTAQLITTAIKADVFKKAPIAAQLTYTSGNQLEFTEGMWIEGVRSPVSGTTAGYIDFHIRACWDVTGSDIPMNLGTIVRLYEPRS